MSIAAGFRARQATRTATIRLAGAVENVFPLFGPVREKLWAAGWEPQIVWPTGREAALGMVFTVRETPGEVFWVITRYEPERHAIAYANVLPGQTLNRIEIACTPAAAGQTDCTVQYSWVGLSEEGNRFVESQTEQAYAAKMRRWAEAINACLATGSAASSL